MLINSSARFQNFIFDADGTLLVCENPYLAIATALQCENIVKEWINKYLNNELSYEELVSKETNIFISQYKQLFGSSPRIGDLEKYLPKIEIRPDAWDIVQYLLEKGKNIYVLSSGFLYLVHDLIQLKIKLDHVHANRFLYDTSGDFIMIKIDVSGEKVDGYEDILNEDHLKKEETVYIGDNAFDEKVINHVLNSGGWVFYLTDSDREFKLKKLPPHDKFLQVDSLYKIKDFV